MHFLILLGAISLLASVFPVVSANTYFSEDPGSCQIIGDTDVYGIGIRLGYYLQYAAAALCLIANRPEDLKPARTGFNAFTIALLINLYRNRDTTLPIEWYIVFLLAFIIPLSVIPRSREDYHKSRTALIVQLLLNYVFITSAPWLFWAGIDVDHKAGCEIAVFFFSKIYLYHHNWRIAGKVISILMVISAYLAVFLELQRRRNPGAKNTQAVFFISYTSTSKPARKNSTAEETDFHLSDGLFPDLTSKWSIVLFKLVALYPGLFAIGFIEKTIVMEGINMSAGPITAAGQLIPLIIGSYIFLDTLISILASYLPISKIARKRKKHQHDEETGRTDQELEERQLDKKDLELLDRLRKLGEPWEGSSLGVLGSGGKGNAVGNPGEREDGGNKDRDGDTDMRVRDDVVMSGANGSAGHEDEEMDRRDE